MPFDLPPRPTQSEAYPEDVLGFPRMKTKAKPITLDKPPECAWCHKRIKKGEHFCSTECQDLYYPPGKKIKTTRREPTIAELQERVEKLRQEAAREEATYVEVELKNGTKVRIVPNELLDLKTFPREELRAKPRCYKCGQEILMSKTTNDKWMPVDEFDDGTFDTHFARCGRE